MYVTLPKGGETVKKITKISSDKPKQNAKKLRVAAYCRVSPRIMMLSLKVLKRKKKHYENYISKREDWTFAGLYFDKGITGTKKEKRPELLRMIADCKAGKIDFVITKSISRFARNTTDCLELVRKLLELDIPIYFEKENLNTSAMESELFLSILSSIAEGESSSISEITNGPFRNDSKTAPSRSAIRPTDITGTGNKWL